MPRTLYITNELPYFPGQGGHLTQKIKYLASQQFTGVVGPRYPHQPEDVLQQLREMVDRSYWWPEPAASGDFFLPPDPELPRTSWLRRLPRKTRHWLWRRLVGLARYSDDALPWRVLINQLAPKILEALKEQPWNSVLLSQSTSVVWLPFLPASLARCIYFHDIRSDYLRRSTVPPSRSNIRRIFAEEYIGSHQADTMAVVSELDRQRAEKLLHPTCPNVVSPISLDVDYFAFQPVKTGSEPVVLFTGHLSHPPNIDAALYFISSIWPRILAAIPQAVFKIVGIQPAPAIIEAIARSSQVELFPYVPDIRPYFKHASVYVVPMRFGGGVRQKILESWAVGVPVVTTTMGAEGIAAEEGVNCWLRDGPGEFAEQVCALLCAPAPESLLQSARAFVEKHHSFHAACPSLTEQVNLAISRRNQLPPRILFDLRWMESTENSEPSLVAAELIDQLNTSDRSFEYRFHGSRRTLGKFKFRRGFKRKVICSDGIPARWLAWRNAAITDLASDLSVPSLLSPELNALEWYTRLDFTVVHGLAGKIPKDLRQFPSVVTIDDLRHLHRPADFTPSDLAARETDHRESCAVAHHVICSSEFIQQDLHQRYGLPLKKMTVVHGLPSRSYETQVALPAARRTLRKLHLKQPYLFYPAAPLPHKNHYGLLQAIGIAHKSLPSDWKLVLTGEPFPSNHPAAALLHELPIRDRVIHLGNIPAGEIAALYRMAEALVFPSFFEGSGLPLIEAILQECPIVCGQHTCLQEIAGDTALFTDVSSPDELANAVVSVATNGPLRSKLRQNCLRNRERFNRKILIDKIRAVYSAVHEQHFT